MKRPQMRGTLQARAGAHGSSPPYSPAPVASGCRRASIRSIQLRSAAVKRPLPVLRIARAIAREAGSSPRTRTALAPRRARWKTLTAAASGGSRAAIRPIALTRPPGR